MENGKHVRITDDQIKLVHADFRTVTLKEKCDLIFCDPPYSKEFIPLYGDLGAWAQANLKRGGYLACYAGHYHLPDVLDQLRRHLDYVWTFVRHPQGLFRRQGRPPAQDLGPLEARPAVQQRQARRPAPDDAGRVRLGP